MSLRWDHASGAAIAIALLFFWAAGAFAGTVHATYLYTLDYSDFRDTAFVNDTSFSDTLWETLVGEEYRCTYVFYLFPLPTPTSECHSYCVNVWTESLSDRSPTGVLTQAFPLGPEEQFSYPTTPWLCQWGSYHAPPRSGGLMRNGSVDTTQLNERNAYVLNRDRPDAVAIVFGMRTYVDHLHRVVSVTVDWNGASPDAVDLPSHPVSWSLSPAYPNPFNGTVAMPFEVGVSGHLSVEVFNLLGQRVSTLLNGSVPAGANLVRWQPQGAASGVYMVRFNGAGFNACQRINYTR